jgi:hypothetical protein
MAHNRLHPGKEPKGSSLSKILHSGRFGESPPGGIQSGALFAERPIICPITMMIFFDQAAFQAGRIVVVNHLVVCARFGFRGEPGTCFHKIGSSLTGFVDDLSLE